MGGGGKDERRCSGGEVGEMKYGTGGGGGMGRGFTCLSFSSTHWLELRKGRIHPLFTPRRRLPMG